MLFMRKEYFQAIRGGAKTTTLRYWRWPIVRAGSVHTIRGLGRVRIDAVDHVRPGDLTDDDARADGFENLAELHTALGRHYPPQRRKDRKLYKVRFTFLPDGQPPGQASKKTSEMR